VGCFRLALVSHQKNLKALLEVTCEEISRLARGIDPEDLERARNQHRAMLLMNLERPLGTAESIARDLMFRGSVWSVEQQLDRIARVQCVDLERAAIEMLRTTPSLSIVGKTGRLSPMKTVERSLAKAASNASV